MALYLFLGNVVALKRAVSYKVVHSTWMLCT